MKGIALIGMLLALLIAAYLLISHINKPAPESKILGKEVPLMDVPNLAKEKLDESMKKEADQLQNIDSE